jgi:hypothetical protein
VDLLGPLFTFDYDTQQKVYVALFTCAVSRAVHLEIVSDLSAAAYILALKRFIARRGSPSCLWSDNGKNFVKGSKCLDQLSTLNVILNSGTLQNTLGTLNLQHKFIPENSPWWGGFWERLIGTVKSSLKIVLETADSPGRVWGLL